MDWRTSAPKDRMPLVGSYFAAGVVALNTNRTPFQKLPETLLCLVGLSRNYYLGDDVYPTFLYDDDQEMDLFSLIRNPNSFKVKTGTRPRAAHEVPLLTATASRIIGMEDTTVASGSSGTPSTIEKSPLDFDNENPTPSTTEGVGAGDQAQDELAHKVPSVETATTTEVVQEPVLEKEVAAMGPTVNKRRSQRGTDEAEANTPPKVLRKDRVTSHPAQSTHGGKSLVAMGLEAGSTFTPVAQETSASAKSVNLLRERLPRSSPNMLLPWRLMSSFPWGVRIQESRPLSNPWMGRQVVGMGSQLRLRLEQEVRLLKEARAKIARRDQRIQVRKEEIKKLDEEIKSLRTMETEVHDLPNKTQNLETLIEAEVDMKKVVEVKNADLAKELKSLRAQFTDLQVNNNQLSQQVSNLQAHVTGEKRIKAPFEEFKKYEDDKVEQRCTEMDARLDALSIDFDEELYPHMLTAITGRRWVIGHSLRLAVMKCDESTKLRQVFANVVSARIVKGMSKGLKHGVEHVEAKLNLAAIEAYDPEADAKYVAALHALKDLKFPLVDQLEKLKDALIDLIMASLHLEGDSGEDHPQWIRELRPSSSQLKIHVYLEVRDPKDPWSIKEEILLEDAIAANISHAEKKKKCRVMCRTHGVGSAHHARSDGIQVSMPTVAHQGLAILLADAATQIEISEDEASPRLLRSKSLPPMYNLDWP
ncbi:hypothetical protein Tco_0016001 [Tanacetum coccineum]